MFAEQWTTLTTSDEVAVSILKISKRRRISIRALHEDLEIRLIKRILTSIMHNIKTEYQSKIFWNSEQDHVEQYQFVRSVLQVALEDVMHIASSDWFSASVDHRRVNDLIHC